MLDCIFNAPVRLALFCTLLGVALGATTLGPLDALVALPAAVAACALVLAAALRGRGLRLDVVRGRQPEHEPADHDGQDFAERHGAAGEER